VSHTLKFVLKICLLIYTRWEPAYTIYSKYTTDYAGLPFKKKKKTIGDMPSIRIVEFYVIYIYIYISFGRISARSNVTKRSTFCTTRNRKNIKRCVYKLSAWISSRRGVQVHDKYIYNIINTRCDANIGMEMSAKSTLQLSADETVYNYRPAIYMCDMY